MNETNIPNENEPLALTAADPKPTETSRTGGGRIIQPITENLVIDPLPPKSPMSAPSLVSNNVEETPFDPIAHDVPYTYAPTTNSSTSVGSVVAIDQTSKENKTSRTITVWVMVLGVFIILTSLYSLVVGIMSAVKYASASGGFGVILSLGQLLLGIGIVKKRELARSIYVIIAIIGMVFTIYSTFMFFSYGQQSYQQSQQVVESVNKQTEKLIVQYQNDESISETEKNQRIEALKENQQKYQQAFSGGNAKTIVSIVLLWATSLVPLIFLTRKRVKQEFN